jgi:hypothetical protein
MYIVKATVYWLSVGDIAYIATVDIQVTLKAVMLSEEHRNNAVRPCYHRFCRYCGDNLIPRILLTVQKCQVHENTMVVECQGTVPSESIQTP